MYGLNIKKIKEREAELIQYKGWLPFPILLYISNVDRREYLEKVGLYDEIYKQNFKYRQQMKMSPNEDLFEEQKLREWIKDNPRFKNLIKK